MPDEKLVERPRALSSVEQALNELAGDGDVDGSFTERLHPEIAMRADDERRTPYTY